MARRIYADVIYYIVASTEWSREEEEGGIVLGETALPT